jgi:hypothetical protein
MVTPIRAAVPGRASTTSRLPSPSPSPSTSTGSTTDNLHGEIGPIPPAEHENDFHRHKSRGDYRRRVSSEPPLNPVRDTTHSPMQARAM